MENGEEARNGSTVAVAFARNGGLDDEGKEETEEEEEEEEA